MTKYPVDTIRNFCVQVWEKAGLSSENARICTDALLAADLRGVRTHGVTHMKDYCTRLSLGTLTDGTDMEFTQTAPSTLVIDAKFAVGAVAANKVMDRCILEAKKSGACLAAVRNGCHYGLGAYYPMKAAKENMIAFSLTNTSPLVAPSGGADPLLGTNPISIAIPSTRYPDLVLDMATSTAAKGKISLALKEGTSIPLGWALNKEGAPTTSPAEADTGSLTPFGGYKGYGLSLVVSLLSFALSGADMDVNLPKFFDRLDVFSNGGYFMGAIDINKFCPAEIFKLRVDAFFDILKNCRPAVGSNGVAIPGEFEFFRMEHALQAGIDLSPATLQDFKALSETFGVPYVF